METLWTGLQMGLAVCNVIISDHGGLFLGLFITGFIGSLTHCLGMCGPLVLSQISSRMESISAHVMTERHRFIGGILFPYHLGRLTTYIALGAVLSGLAGQMIQGEAFRWVAASFLILAALFLLGMAFPHLKFILGKWSQPFQGWWSGKLKGWISPWFAAPFGWRAYGLGIALGFIPCGLVYAALAAAIAGGGMITGALAMAAFAFGTMPSLIILGIGGQFALNRWRGAILQWAPLLLVFNAALLGFMAWQTIP